MRTDTGWLQSFKFAAFMGTEPEGCRIMPSSIRMPGAVTVTMTRSADLNNQSAIEVFISVDGANWSFGGRPSTTQVLAAIHLL